MSWSSPLFADPLDLFVSAVATIEFPQRDMPRPPTGYCLEWDNGDAAYGELLSADSRWVELQSETMGLLRADRSHVRRLFRVDHVGQLIFLGPQGMQDWETPRGEQAARWRAEGAQLIADADNARLSSRFDLPSRFTVEFELSWEKETDWILELGADRKSEKPAALRLEIWDDSLVAVAEDDSQADVALLTALPNDGRLNLRLFVDQTQNLCVVFKGDGERLGQAKLITTGQPLPVLRWTHRKGMTRLENLRVAKWIGQETPASLAKGGRMHLSSGELESGELVGFDRQERRFAFADGEREWSRDESEVESVIFSSQPASANNALHASLHDRSRISGILQRVQDGNIVLQHQGLEQPVKIALADLAGLRFPKVGDALPVMPVGRDGRLQSNDLRLRGVLTPAAKAPEQANHAASCLAWHAWGARSGARLAANASASIIYREPAPTVSISKAERQRRIQNNRQGVLGALFGAFSNSPRIERSDRSLHLRTGDTVVCDAQSIDEHGVTFTSEMTETTFMPHAEILALELADLVQGAELNGPKRERLLTLPRMQRNDPPTHLIVSTSGDHLRARLLAMDEETLTVEVRLDVRQIPRKHVARIIWLRAEDQADDDPDPLDPASSTDDAADSVKGGVIKTPASSPAIHMQAVRSNGKRLTFDVTEYRDQILSGDSQLLGPCHVSVDDVDRLHFGADVEAAAAELAIQQWRLVNAVEPKFVTADGQKTRVAGTESSLVGKPAPEFSLELLDGDEFSLSQQRGSIIVLDFWASWCGPCIRAMPIVEGVVEEFRDDKVRLIAVNLQEDPDSIRAALERMKLNPAVALDIDGVAAARYSATAIPQTVIIDRKGMVARLFVGGGADFGEQLREALQAVIDEQRRGIDADRDAPLMHFRFPSHVRSDFSIHQRPRG